MRASSPLQVCDEQLQRAFPTISAGSPLGIVCRNRSWARRKWSCASAVTVTWMRYRVGADEMARRDSGIRLPMTVAGLRNRHRQRPRRTQETLTLDRQHLHCFTPAGFRGAGNFRHSTVSLAVDVARRPCVLRRACSCTGHSRAESDGCRRSDAARAGQWS